MATQWAQGKKIDALILAASYSSWYDASREHYKYVLQKLFFLPNSFVSLEAIKNISVPTLFLHGNTDTLISIEQGRNVFLNAFSGAYFLEIDDADHYNLLEKEATQFHIAKFLSEKKLDRRYTFLDDTFTLNSSGSLDTSETLFDFESDTSFTKYVDPLHSFSSLSYVPSDLEYFSHNHILDEK